MSFYNGLRTILTNPLVSSQTSNLSAGDSSSNAQNESFDSVMIKALQNCNGKRPAHVCCCHEVPEESLIEENKDVKEIDNNDNSEETKNAKEASISKEAEEAREIKEGPISVGQCFSLFLKVSVKITTRVGSAMDGNFGLATMASNDSVGANKSCFIKNPCSTMPYNEYILSEYLKKSNSLFSTNSSGISSMAGYSAVDASNIQLESILNGNTSTGLTGEQVLKAKGFGGRILEIIRETDIEANGLGGYRLKKAMA